MNQLRELSPCRRQKKPTVVQFRCDFLLGLVIGNHDNNEVGQSIVYYSVRDAALAFFLLLARKRFFLGQFWELTVGPSKVGQLRKNERLCAFNMEG